jgi:hypothetical protein
MFASTSQGGPHRTSPGAYRSSPTAGNRRRQEPESALPGACGARKPDLAPAELTRGQRPRASAGCRLWRTSPMSLGLALSITERTVSMSWRQRCRGDCPTSSSWSYRDCAVAVSSGPTIGATRSEITLDFRERPSRRQPSNLGTIVSAYADEVQDQHHPIFGRGNINFLLSHRVHDNSLRKRSRASSQ